MFVHPQPPQASGCTEMPRPLRILPVHLAHFGEQKSSHPRKEAAILRRLRHPHVARGTWRFTSQQAGFVLPITTISPCDSGGDCRDSITRSSTKQQEIPVRIRAALALSWHKASVQRSSNGRTPALVYGGSRPSGRSPVCETGHCVISSITYRPKDRRGAFRTARSFPKRQVESSNLSADKVSARGPQG